MVPESGFLTVYTRLCGMLSLSFYPNCSPSLYSTHPVTHILLPTLTFTSGTGHWSNIVNFDPVSNNEYNIAAALTFSFLVSQCCQTLSIHLKSKLRSCMLRISLDLYISFRVTKQTLLQKNLDEALSNANWGVANSILYDISKASDI